MSAVAAAPESLLDLPRLAAGIRWRRRLWGGIALAGLVLGALSAVVLPSHTAVTRVLIVHEDESAGGAGGLMETDVALFETSSLAAQVIERLGLDVPPDEFLGTFAGEGLTDNILEITATAATDADAVARAQVLADVFIADHVRRTRDAAEAEAAAFRERRDSVQADLAAVEDEIDAVFRTTGLDPVDAAAQLQTLYARRSALSIQSQEFAQRADDAAVGAPRVGAGTHVVDAPRPVTPSLAVNLALSGGIGLLLGLGVGIAAAAVATLVADRPVLRRDIAEGLGASVLVQLPAPRRIPGRGPRSRRADEEFGRAASALVRLSRDAPGGVSLLELGAPAATRRLAAAVVAELRGRGPVLVVDDVGDDRLRKALDRAPDGVRVVAGADDDDVVRAHGEQLVGYGSVGPGSDCLDLDRLGAETVLVVRAGRADAAWLHTVARHVSDQGVGVLGIVLVHPDPRDVSDGTLWDGLHHALRGRARPPAAAAANGTTPINGTANGITRNGVTKNGTAINGTANNGTANNGTANNGTTKTDAGDGARNDTTGHGGSGSGSAAAATGDPPAQDLAVDGVPGEAVEVT